MGKRNSRAPVSTPADPRWWPGPCMTTSEISDSRAATDCTMAPTTNARCSPCNSSDSDSSAVASIACARWAKIAPPRRNWAVKLYRVTDVACMCTRISKIPPLKGDPSMGHFNIRASGRPNSIERLGHFRRASRGRTVSYGEAPLGRQIRTGMCRSCAGREAAKAPPSSFVRDSRRS
jgi:hypothetical protein